MSIRLSKCKKKKCEECSCLIPIGEGDHICDNDPTKMVLCEYEPTEDYGWCNNVH